MLEHLPLERDPFSLNEFVKHDISCHKFNFKTVAYATGYGTPSYANVVNKFALRQDWKVILTVVLPQDIQHGGRSCLQLKCAYRSDPVFDANNNFLLLKMCENSFYTGKFKSTGPHFVNHQKGIAANDPPLKNHTELVGSHLVSTGDPTASPATFPHPATGRSVVIDRTARRTDMLACLVKWLVQLFNLHH